MSSQLASLRRHSVIVADTSDLSAIARHAPQDATTNPSLILKAASDPRYADIVDEVIASVPAHEKGVDALQVAFGRRILALVPGRVSTEVDARLSFDTEATQRHALELVERYAAHAIPPARVLIKIASTWEGIRAAARLERQGVRCNLTLMFSLTQASACADAGVTLVSPFVGRIDDWHRRHEPAQSCAGDMDPGVAAVRLIHRYLKQFGYPTQVMGASFRSPAQILDLAGCDLLTISPALLETLDATEGDVARQLPPSFAPDADLEQLRLDEAGFRWRHNEDAMSVELLADGIRRFAADTCRLEALIESRRGR